MFICFRCLFLGFCFDVFLSTTFVILQNVPEIQEVIKSARIQDFESLKVINFKRSRRHPDHSLKCFRLALLSEMYLKKWGKLFWSVYLYKHVG
jgi:hypothetical protein